MVFQLYCFLNRLPKDERLKGTMMKAFDLLRNTVIDNLQKCSLKLLTNNCIVTNKLESIML